MLIAILLTLVIWGLIFYLLWWLLGVIALPAPFSKVATVIIAVAAVIVVIGILTGSIHSFPFLQGLVK